MSVKLVSISKPCIEGLNTAEDLISYCARVSNPSNQLNTETAPKLLNYLIKHKHWSPYEMVSMTLELQTSRAIAAQILRHRSFSFQEFSQRYAKKTDLQPLEWRKQGETNRQVGDEEVKLSEVQKILVEKAQFFALEAYNYLVQSGVAKECARMVLPLNTSTTIYMSGTARSWLSYFNVRLETHTQKEHRDIAYAAAKIFAEVFPVTTEAVNNFNNFEGNFM